MSLFWKREAGNAPATWAEGGPGGGGVSEITSDDATVTITNPDGPTVDLSVLGGSTPFTGWTGDDSDPANIESNGGALALGGGNLDTEGGSLNAGVTRAQAGSNDTPSLSTKDADGHAVFQFYNLEAPASGDLPSGMLAFWFDNTDGAPKLMLKGKSADGTVVSGEIALT